MMKEELPINKIILGNCVDTMKSFPDDCINLTICSPPYDGLRKYNGYCFDFPAVASELYRITKPGGVVVWNVADQTVDGDETGTSFDQALYFKRESGKASTKGEVSGFKLHDTMIWEKPNPITFGFDEAVRNNPSFEYMFVFVKGKLKTFNPLLVKTKTGGKKYSSVKVMGTSGKPTREKIAAKTTNDKKLMSNIWSIPTAVASGDHPAIFPETMVWMHAYQWSNPGDVVFDPFMGSGTTAIGAMRNGCNFVGCEISEEYRKGALARIAAFVKDDANTALGLKMLAGEVVNTDRGLGFIN